MHVLFKSLKRNSKVFLIPAFLPFLLNISVVSATPPTSSLIMPNAYKSLLLDIEKVGSKIVVVGERGHILISNDDGKTWKQSPVPVIQMLNAVDFANESLGWAVGHDGNIVHTVDGGSTWTLQRDGLKKQKELNISNVNDLKSQIAELEIKVSENPEEEVLSETATLPPLDSVSEDDELSEDVESVEKAPLTLREQLEKSKLDLEDSEALLTEPAIAAPLMDVWFSDTKTGWAVGSFGLLLQTFDGGATWINRSKDIVNTTGYRDSSHLNSIIGAGGVIYLAGEAGFLSLSRDDGQTWTKVNLDYDGTIFGLISDKEGSIVIATGLRGNTFSSIDKGETWQPITPGIDYSLSSGAVFDSNNIILVGTAGSIAISGDRGVTFKQYTLPSRMSLSSLIVLDNNNFMLVGQGGISRFDSSALLK